MAMYRQGCKHLARAIISPLPQHKAAARSLTNIQFTPDLSFRNRMMALEQRGKAGRFYVVDPPVVSHLAKVLKPLIKEKNVIHATPGPGVFTCALFDISEAASIRILDHNGFFMEAYEHLQESKYPDLKVFMGNAMRMQSEESLTEEAADLDSLTYAMYPTIEEVLDGIPDKTGCDPSHVMLAPFGMETLHTLAILIPQVCDQSSWLSKGACPIIGAVACKKDDPVLLGSQPKDQVPPYYYALLEQVYSIETLEELPANCVHARTKSWPFGKDAVIRFLSFTPKEKKNLPNIFDLALGRLIYPRTDRPKLPVFDHIRAHGIADKVAIKIMKSAGIQKGATVDSVPSEKFWKVLTGYKTFCEDGFLEELFSDLAVVKYSDEPDSFHAIEAEEERRVTKDYGMGLDRSFWDIRSSRFQRTARVAEADTDMLYESEAFQNDDGDNYRH